MSKAQPRDRAWMPAEYTVRHVECLKALSEGKAGEHEQRIAYDWIVSIASGIHELSYRSDSDGGDRETAFAEGRRFVGMQIEKLAKMPPRILAAMRSQEEKKNGR